MPFDSHVFVLLFLPFLLAAWRVVAIVRREQLSLVLLVFSLLYCFWASPAALVLFGLLASVNYVFGLALAAPGEREGSLRRRGLLGLAVLVNLAPLVLMRWGPALSGLLTGLPHETSLAQALPALLSAAPAEGESFVLETARWAGCSFWFLIQTAWLCGVYRRHTEPEGFFRHYLFSFSFPTLLTGPVVRYEQMGPQYDHLNAPSLDLLARGLGLFIAGLAKKLLLADWLGRLADPAFAAASQGLPLSCPETWLGVLAFSFEIYFDFSACADMALGCGLMLGLRLPRNFAAPYRATGFIEFWRRWHITFSAWLRDCVFQPLTGPAPGPCRLVFSVALALLVTGLWHGSALTFLVWAGLHGVFLALNAAVRALCRKAPLEGLLSTLPARLFCTALTFVLVSLCWTVFRADSLSHAAALFAALAGQGTWPAALTLRDLLPGLVPLSLSALCVFALPTAHDIFLGCRDGSRPWPAFSFSLPWAVLLAAATALSLCLMDAARPFIF